MNERYYKTGIIPRLVPPGRVLAHNRVQPDLDGFRCWTWLKPDVPSDFQTLRVRLVRSAAPC
jgi:hypothetical protein